MWLGVATPTEKSKNGMGNWFVPGDKEWLEVWKTEINRPSLGGRFSASWKSEKIRENRINIYFSPHFKGIYQEQDASLGRNQPMAANTLPND